MLEVSVKICLEAAGAHLSHLQGALVLGKWQELWEGFLISTSVSLALDCLFVNSCGDFLPGGMCLKYLIVNVLNSLQSFFIQVVK